MKEVNDTATTVGDNPSGTEEGSSIIISKSGKTPAFYRVAAIGLVLVTACAIGLAVYAVNAKSDAEKHAKLLENELEHVNDTDCVCLTPETADCAEDMDDSVPAPVAKGGPYIDKGYFIVPDWGAMYKLSDKLSHYAFNIVNPATPDSAIISLTAHYGTRQYAPQFANIHKCSLIMIQRNNGEALYHSELSDVVINGYHYYSSDGLRSGERLPSCAYSGLPDEEADALVVISELRAVFSKPMAIK